jgi:type I restriction-modification system DNA methylase subunit
MATELKTPELSRIAATTFADKWKSYTDEKQHARGFWSDFFRTLCGVDDEEIAGIEYEKRVKSTISGNQEYIDVYWKNVALIEHKSAGENLDKAELQARGYWLSLPPGYRPKTIIISDFLNFRLIDVALNRTHDFLLSNLPENIHRFEAIISGNRTRISEEEISVDQEAAKLMANLYLELEAHGFEGHETSIFLIRILFLLFGDDTGMWKKNSFLKLVMGTKEDGNDVGSKLDTLFDLLNSPIDKRAKSVAEEFKDFPYVNGGIFAEKISMINFNKKMRVALVDVANYDWTTINPTIFGSLFQLIKNKEARRELGEHYTSEENINKIVYPLFLDELQERLAAAWDNKKELKKLRQDLAKIKIFDPACGCGNFLVVSYRHLRQLELELIVRLNNLEGNQDSMQLDGSMGLSISLNQFHGIEIEEWPAQVAQMALYLTDHQENKKLERITGESPNRFPITASARIEIGNALEKNWNEFIDFDENTYLLGNPPFYGARWQNAEQKADTARIWAGTKGAGELDYVTNWFYLAAKSLKGTQARAALVSTNSISQGEQPAIVWSRIWGEGIKIDFAHRSFTWNNESSGKAAVTCVIIGFSSEAHKATKQLWIYEKTNSTPQLTNPSNINSYLLDGPNVLITARKKPLNKNIPQLENGSMPNDGGYLSNISKEEADEIKLKDVIAAKYLRRIMGAREMIHNEERFCLWLVDAKPSELRESKVLAKRVSEVLKLRMESKRVATQKLASSPHEFGEVRQPKTDYVAVPRITSEERRYVPIGFFGPEIVMNDKISFIEGGDLFIFGVLSSSIFNIWNKAISGRTRNDTLISNTITYNNFPFPSVNQLQKSEVMKSAQAVLDVRKEFQNETFADLYGKVSMPTKLQKAHQILDASVLSVFGIKATSSEKEILEHLFSAFISMQSQTLL